MGSSRGRGNLTANAAGRATGSSPSPQTIGEGDRLGLSNGKQVMATKEGSVALGDKLILTDVLYVPELNCNLIFVLQLLATSFYRITFTDKFCVIHDRNSRTLIGAGEQSDGVYWYKQNHHIQANQVGLIDQHKLWHQGLGHPSHKVISLLPFFARSENKAHMLSKDSCECEVCLRAHQKRSVFPLSDNKATEIIDNMMSVPSSVNTPNRFVDDDLEVAVTINQPFHHMVSNQSTNDMEQQNLLSNQQSPNNDQQSSDVNINSTHSDSTDFTSTENIAPVELLGKGHRLRKPSSRLTDFITHTIHVKNPVAAIASPSPNRASRTPFHLAHYVNCDAFSVRHKQFLAAITAGEEPISFSEANKSSKWRTTIKEEIDALEKNGTWTLEDLPPGKTALGYKWVYKIKYKEDGSIERYKGRLVVFGNRQKECIDFGETFAPVAKMVTVRMFLAVAAAKNWELHQMDVHNAFLHGDLDEEVYMKLPPGFNSLFPGKVFRLRKSLYGLRQTPRQWFAKLSATLKFFDFKQSYADYSLFYYTKGDVSLHVLVYMDDLIITACRVISW
ncbi:uncharacterized protein LOC141713884 [Apium graveolens]|uniref:uncharacterized protein LOC141713884 n=1 Tax=Apium graveolens TaxID=4045 RepID=UPI003D7962FA